MGADETMMTDAAARHALKEDLARNHCRIAQPEDPPLFTREPNSPSVSSHWRWSELEPLLERIGREVDLASGGPRRTLRLQDPGLPYGTTPTMWASIQVILPGEVATAHRHTANAFRFIMHGTGAWTTVDGESYPMNEGDLVLTPTQCWHDHVHRGDAPMIWLDMLDISLMRAMHATFFEGYPHSVQPLLEVPDASWRTYGSGLLRPPGVAGTGAISAAGFNPLLAYPARVTDEALAQARGLPADPCDDVVLAYVDPRNGGPVMKTVDCRAQVLRPGFRGRARRQVGSKIYYVVDGSGTTIVNDRRFDWSKGDFFTIAPWAWHEHSNPHGGDARLFQVSDAPALKALGYYREEVRAEAPADARPDQRAEVPAMAQPEAPAAPAAGPQVKR